VLSYPLRITFSSPEAAHRLFSEFPPQDLPYVEAWSRKREGSSQLIILGVSEPEDLSKFEALCRSTPEVIGVESIDEADFWKAASNAV
jgi:hypothetical protein